MPFHDQQEIAQWSHYFKATVSRAEAEAQIKKLEENAAAVSQNIVVSISVLKKFNLLNKFQSVIKRNPILKNIEFSCDMLDDLPDRDLLKTIRAVPSLSYVGFSFNANSRSNLYNYINGEDLKYLTAFEREKKISLRFTNLIFSADSDQKSIIVAITNMIRRGSFVGELCLSNVQFWSSPEKRELDSLAVAVSSRADFQLTLDSVFVRNGGSVLLDESIDRSKIIYWDVKLDTSVQQDLSNPNIESLLIRLRVAHLSQFNTILAGFPLVQDGLYLMIEDQISNDQEVGVILEILKKINQQWQNKHRTLELTVNPEILDRLESEWIEFFKMVKTNLVFRFNYKPKESECYRAIEANFHIKVYVADVLQSEANQQFWDLKEEFLPFYLLELDKIDKPTFEGAIILLTRLFGELITKARKETNYHQALQTFEWEMAGYYIDALFKYVAVYAAADENNNNANVVLSEKFLTGWLYWRNYKITTESILGSLIKILTVQAAAIVCFDDKNDLTLLILSLIYTHASNYKDYLNEKFLSLVSASYKNRNVTIDLMADMAQPERLLQTMDQWVEAEFEKRNQPVSSENNDNDKPQTTTSVANLVGQSRANLHTGLLDDNLSDDESEEFGEEKSTSLHMQQ